MSITGEPDGDPIRIGTSIGDLSAGVFAYADKLFDTMCTRLGLPALVSDQRFSSNEKRVENYGALKPALYSVTSGQLSADIPARPLCRPALP